MTVKQRGYCLASRRKSGGEQRTCGQGRLICRLKQTEAMRKISEMKVGEEE